MPLDGVFLGFLTAELNELCGSNIEKIHCPAGGEFVFTLRKKKLFICLNGTPYITVLGESFDNPEKPPMFCMLLRKHLCSGRITAVEKVANDRIVIFKISSRGELGDVFEYSLIAELYGTKANLILAAADGKIIDAYRRSDIETSKRLIQPGARYTIPEGGGSGYSPLIERELAFRNTTIDKLIENACPTMLVDENGDGKDFTFTDIVQYGSLYRMRRFESYLELVKVFFTERRRKNAIDTASSEVKKQLKNLIARAEKKLFYRREEQKKSEQKEKYRVFGELIKANIYAIERGAPSVRVQNYYDDCKEITIPLSTALSPQANAAKYFKEYKKLCNAAAALDELIKSSEEEIYYLKSVAEELERAENSSDVEAVKRELCEAGYIRSRQKSTKKEPAAHFKRYEAGGFTILVGRNNNENDRLTLKTAAKNDLWFHTKNIPGSHVVILTGGAAPGDDVLLYAANLAALHSSAKDSGQVAVDYTEIKNIKKPAGAKPGMVIYKTNKTVYVTPDSKAAQPKS